TGLAVDRGRPPGRGLVRAGAQRRRGAARVRAGHRRARAQHEPRRRCRHGQRHRSYRSSAARAAGRAWAMSTAEAIRTVLGTYGGLPCPMDDVAEADDLYRRGLTSHASVNVMLALEAEFDVEFDDAMLRKSTF